MTTQHELDRQLDAFLSDGPTELPDPSFDAVRDESKGPSNGPSSGRGGCPP